MSDNRKAFFERYAAAAIEEQKRYGIPASVTLAQMAVESGYGESSLAKQDNNYFGIKASKSWLNAGKPWSYHHDDHYNDKFCTFASPLESLEYHSKVLMANRYKACFQYSSDDHYHWISGIKAGGYATDPGYVAKIEKVIKDYGLERFDKQAIAEAYQQGIQIGYARNGESPVSGVKSQPIPETTVLLPENSRYSFPIQAEVMTVTSPFGHRTAPKAGASTEHMGLDIRAQYQPVLATEDKGRVLSARNEGKGGNVIRVEYERSDGSKYQTAYMHLSQFNVHEGDVVNAGQQIGISGNTGNSTGPHLHFSVKRIPEFDHAEARIDVFFSYIFQEICNFFFYMYQVVFHGTGAVDHKYDIRPVTGGAGELFAQPVSVGIDRLRMKLVFITVIITAVLRKILEQSIFVRCGDPFFRGHRFTGLNSGVPKFIRR